MCLDKEVVYLSDMLSVRVHCHIRYEAPPESVTCGGVGWELSTIYKANIDGRVGVRQVGEIQERIAHEIQVLVLCIYN